MRQSTKAAAAAAAAPLINTAATSPTMVLGVYVGVLLMVEIVLLTLNFAGNWTFSGHGVVVLLPLYFLYFLLIYWLMGNEMRGAEQVRNVLAGKMWMNERADMKVTEAMAMQANNRVWGFKVLFGTLPIVIAANVRMDLTRYDISPWAVGGVALFVVAVFTAEGAARGKMWWHDALSDYLARLSEDAGDDEDLDADRL